MLQSDIPIKKSRKQLPLPRPLKADSYWWVCKTNWCN